MSVDIRIMEKPDWVSWEDIRQCLYDAHSVNRSKGIYMTKYLLPTEKIVEYIGSSGIMLVALDGKKVVGTAAICERYGKKWYAKGRYAYLSFDSVLPMYKGQGIFREMERMREKIILSQNYSVILVDTHKKNKRRIKTAELSGYHIVSCTYSNIIFAKWLASCPYSKFYCKFRFCISWVWARLRFVLSVVKRRVVNKIYSNTRYAERIS